VERDLDEREALEAIAGVMLDTGFNAPRVKEVIDAAAQRAPDAAGVRVLRMRLAVRDRDDVALGRLLQASGSETRDPVLARGEGLALFERVRNTDAGQPDGQLDAWRAQAFELLDRSLTAQADDAEAAWAFGLLSARLRRDPQLAMRRLQRASELMPRNAELAMAKASLCEANGQTVEMIPYLVDVATFTSSVEQRQWARQRIAAAKAAPAGARQP
jgi:hypothetical protein